MNSLVNKYGWILIVIILLYGLFLRTYDLSLDAPMTTGTFSQDLATDPYHITSFAANKAKFGQWEFFNYPKWQVFKVSLPSMMAYLLYSIGEVNIFWTHLAGVILGFAGLLFFLYGIRRNTISDNLRPVTVAALFLASNFIFVTYSRAPFLETGVMLCFGLIASLLHKDKLSTINLLIISVLISIACLAGRIFGITIGLALLATLLLGEDKDKIKKSGILIGGTVASAAILLFLLYGGRIDAYLQYLSEHSETSGGNLYMFRGIGAFIQVLFSYGTGNQLFRAAPFLFIAGYAALTAAIIAYRRHHEWFRRNFMLRFSLWWLLLLFLFFFPFNYRPLRYSLLLYLPLVLIIVSMIDIGELKKKACSKTMSFLSAGLLFLVNLFFLIHVVIDFFIYPIHTGKQLVTYAYVLPAALLLTFVMLLPQIGIIFDRLIPKLGRIITVLAVCAILFQSYTFFNWLNHSHHTTETAAGDMADIIGDGAVIAGPYAPRLTLNSNAKSFIYYFGLDRPDASIFESYPITHISVDKSNLEAAIKDFPELHGAMISTDQMIRGRTVLLIRLVDSTSNYEPTLYEKAERFFNTGIVDSALIYNREFRARFPDNIPGMKQAYDIFHSTKSYEGCLAVLDELKFRHPDNADAMFFCTIYYKMLGKSLNRQNLIELSKECLDKTKWFYMSKEENLQRGYDQL